MFFFFSFSFLLSSWIKNKKKKKKKLRKGLLLRGNELRVDIGLFVVDLAYTLLRDVQVFFVVCVGQLNLMRTCELLESKRGWH